MLKSNVLMNASALSPQEVTRPAVRSLPRGTEAHAVHGGAACGKGSPCRGTSPPLGGVRGRTHWWKHLLRHFAGRRIVDERIPREPREAASAPEQFLGSVSRVGDCVCTFPGIRKTCHLNEPQPLQAGRHLARDFPQPQSGCECDRNRLGTCQEADAENQEPGPTAVTWGRTPAHGAADHKLTVTWLRICYFRGQGLGPIWSKACVMGLEFGRSLPA